MSYYDTPQVCIETNPKARKEHRCCECRGVIQIGERYEYCTGIWDEPDTFKTCHDCVELRDEIAKKFNNNTWTYGGLFESSESEPWASKFRMIVEKRKRKEAAL